MWRITDIDICDAQCELRCVSYGVWVTMSELSKKWKCLRSQVSVDRSQVSGLSVNGEDVLCFTVSRRHGNL